MSAELSLPPYVSDIERRQLRDVVDAAASQLPKVIFEQRSRIKDVRTISKYHGNATPDRYLPIDIAVEMDRANASPLILSTAAAMLGYRLVPAGEAESGALALADAREVAKETGDVINLLLSLIVSGKPLDATDRHDLRRELSEAKSVLFRLDAKIGGQG